MHSFRLVVGQTLSLHFLFFPRVRYTPPALSSSFLLLLLVAFRSEYRRGIFFSFILNPHFNRFYGTSLLNFQYYPRPAEHISTRFLDMTTAPLIAYPTMEVPATGDSMEMASPYQGQADDFDIDIDLMEDHVSNMDSDMMGADEFTSTAQPNELDAIYDADMADEPSEGSMIDADNYADEDNDIDVQFEEEPYEEEMIETDQAEEMNTAAPVIHLEPAGSNEDAASPIKEDATVTTVEPLKPAPQGTSGSMEVAPVQDETQASGVEGPDTQAQPSTTVDDDLAEEPSETVISPETAGHNGKSELGEEANEVSQSSVSETEATQVPNEDPEASQTKNSIEDPHIDDAVPEAQPGSEGNNQVADEDESLQQVTYIDEPIHPVKILYQDCEIALFPPLEGDLADTFFIEDEALAYENIDQIFKALRQVLQKTMAGNEVLVIDIDTLGIQMTEVSTFSIIPHRQTY